MTTFSPAQIDRNGTYFIHSLVGVDIEAIADAFPEGRAEAYDDPEKGYDARWEVGFVDQDGNEWNIYARWGQCRIGGRRFDSEDTTLARCRELRNFIVDALRRR